MRPGNGSLGMRLLLDITACDRVYRAFATMFVTCKVCRPQRPVDEAIVSYFITDLRRLL